MKLLLRAILPAVCLLFAPAFALGERSGVIGDYDGDGRSDIVVTRAVAGQWQWFFRLATGEERALLFGLAPDGNEDTLLAGNYDGDSDFEPGVVRAANGLLYWYTLDNTAAVTETQWGLDGDTPLAGFFGGSGESDRVAIRSVGGQLVWFIQGVAESGIPWGLDGDTPFAADLNGDQVDELVVARNSGGSITWFARDVAGNFTASAPWGLDGDRMLPPADFNGDGKADLVVTRGFGAFQVAFINYDVTNQSYAQSVLFGLTGDTPYSGYFTQSTLAELAMYRQSTFLSTHFVRFFDETVTGVPFGLVGDTLVQPEGRAAEEPESSVPGCVATPGTATSFSDGAGGGALWKPISEGVPNHASVVLLPISYCGAGLTVLGADGSVVSGVQRTKCGGNGNRAHFWIARTASQMSAFAPLTVQVTRGGVTECRSVPNPNQRYD
ncbi:MAG: VCBS repeat-containing protein [Bdellovibrionales bacterium]|nr:VCBS repeat-containing protein [Bdellovibrionales bacterium]